MFKLASIVHKQTREHEEEAIGRLLSTYREGAIKRIEESKCVGTYKTFICTRQDSLIEKEALLRLKSELKEKGYKVSISYEVSKWDGNYYTLRIKWSTYTK